MGIDVEGDDRLLERVIGLTLETRRQADRLDRGGRRPPPGIPPPSPCWGPVSAHGIWYARNRSKRIVKLPDAPGRYQAINLGGNGEDTPIGGTRGDKYYSV